VRLRWDRIQVGDMVDMAPQPVMPVVSRAFNERSGLWALGFLHPKWRRVWRIAYIGWHEEEVEPWGRSADRFIEGELVMWMAHALELRDLLRHQNGSLYRAARDRDRLLAIQWPLDRAQERADACVAAFEAAHGEIDG